MTWQTSDFLAAAVEHWSAYDFSSDSARAPPARTIAMIAVATICRFMDCRFAKRIMLHMNHGAAGASCQCFPSGPRTSFNAARWVGDRRLRSISAMSRITGTDSTK
jgi:hypothetical protein